MLYPDKYIAIAWIVVGAIIATSALMYTIKYFYDKNASQSITDLCRKISRSGFTITYLDYRGDCWSVTAINDKTNDTINSVEQTLFLALAVLSDSIEKYNKSKNIKPHIPPEMRTEQSAGDKTPSALNFNEAKS